MHAVPDQMSKAAGGKSMLGHKCTRTVTRSFLLASLCSRCSGCSRAKAVSNLCAGLHMDRGCELHTGKSLLHQSLSGQSLACAIGFRVRSRVLERCIPINLPHDCIHGRPRSSRVLATPASWLIIKTCPPASQHACRDTALQSDTGVSRTLHAHLFL